MRRRRRRRRRRTDEETGLLRSNFFLKRINDETCKMLLPTHKNNEFCNLDPYTAHDTYGAKRIVRKYYSTDN
jgi:hypothetical protein